MNSYQICYVDEADVACSEIVQAATLIDAWDIAMSKGSKVSVFADTPVTPGSPLATGMAKLVALGLTPSEALAIAAGEAVPIT